MNKKDIEYLDNIENRKDFAESFAQNFIDDDLDFMEIYNKEEL